MIGIIYFAVILGACIIGAIVGLGGGVFIRPIFDTMNLHSMLNIQFFSSSAIFTMAIVSTIKKIQDGTKIDARKALLISIGAVFGGFIGNMLIERLIGMFDTEDTAGLIQIAATIVVLICSLILTVKSADGKLRFEIKSKLLSLALGIVLGTVATFLGIGGGPINVPIMIILFGLNIKDATAYSIVIIFFSHLSRLITMGITVGYGYFDVQMLIFVIPAAILGGLIGAKFSKIFSETMVRRLFLIAISAVIVLNIVNAVILMRA